MGSRKPRRLVLLVAVLVAMFAIGVVTTGHPQPDGSRSNERSEEGYSESGGTEPPARNTRREPPRLIWSGDVETGDLSQFKDTPENTAGGGSSPEVVSDPAFVPDGRHALQMTISRAGRGEGVCCGSRSEVEPKIDDLRPGDDLYFGFSTLLAEGFPTQAGWQVITQWKNDFDGSPPLELSLERGHYFLSGGYGHPDGPHHFSKPLGPAETGRRVDWVFHIKFSPDPEVGFVEVWRSGELVLPRFHPEGGTLYPDSSSYLKTGYYRHKDISAPGTIYFDSWKIGTSREVVSHVER